MRRPGAVPLLLFFISIFTAVSATQVTDSQFNPANAYIYNNTNSSNSTAQLVNFNQNGTFSNLLELRDYSYNNNRTGIAGEWLFDSMNATDTGGNGNNGTFSGGITSCNVPGVGGQGYACDFDGINDYINIPNGFTNTIKGNDAHTIEFWVYPRSLSNLPVILDGPGLGSLGMFIELGNTTTNTEYWGYSGSYRTYSGTVLPLNAWSHVAVVKAGAGNSGTLYINGVAQASYTGTLGNTPNSASDFNAGTYHSGNFALNGTVDGLVIYNRSLSAQEIYEDYYADPKAQYPQNLSWNWQTKDALLTMHFDQSSPNQVDSSGYGNNGTVYGNANYTPSGKFGGAMVFDGNTSKVSIGSPLITGTGDFTIEAWINRASAGTYDYIAGNHGGANNALEFYVGTNNRLLGYAAGGSMSGVSTLSAGTWYHVAFVRSSGTATLYLNGVYENSAVITNSIPGNLNFTIGNGPDYTSEAFGGAIDEVNVYSRALTAAEILAHNNSAKPPQGLNVTNVTVRVRYSNATNELYNNSGLAGWWNFNQNTTASGGILDYSGNGYNGNATGGATFKNGTSCYPFGDGCYEFDGASGYVALPDALETTGNTTVEYWFNIRNDGTALSKWSSGSGWNYISRIASSTGSATFDILNSASSWQLLSTPAGSFGSGWNYFAFVKNGSSTAIYINGVRKANGSVSGTLLTGAPINIGRRADGAEYVNGTVDSVRMYSRVLSDDEIRWNYYHASPNNFTAWSNYYPNDLNSQLLGASPARFVQYEALLSSSNSTYTPVLSGVSIAYSNQSTGTSISFIPPTPSDGSVSSQTSIYVNTSISGTGNLSAFVDLDRSLVGYWSFDNVSGTTIYDSSTHGNNGTTSGSLSVTNGVFGNASVFSGGGAYATNTDYFTGNHDYTFTMWMNASSYPCSTCDAPLIWYGSTGSRHVASLSLHSNQLSSLHYADDAIFSFSPALGTAYFVALTYNASTYAASLYVNGAYQQTLTHTGLLNIASTNLSIGHDNDGGGRSYSGMLDEVRIWNRTLSPQEINASYNAGSYRLEQNYTNLGFGNHTFYAYAVDSTGGWSRTETRSVSISAAPTSTSISFVPPTPADSSALYGSSLYVNTSVAGTGNLSAFIDFDRSLVGYWNFDNVNGTTVYDASTYGNNGTLTGSSAAVAGRSGNARNFSGGSDLLSINSININGIPYTIEAWFVYPLASSSAGWNTLVRGNSLDHQVLVSTGTKEIGVYDNTAGAFRGSGYIMSGLSNGWHHLAAIGSGNTTVFYIDGVYRGTSQFKSNSQISTIGNYIGLNQQFGTIDEVRIWNRTLSAQEINASYSAGSYRLEQNYTNLGFGNHTFYAYAVDSTGGWNRTETRTVSVTTQINFPQNASYLGFSNFTLNISAAPAPDSCWYSLNNGANTSIPSCQPATFTAAAGSNTITIYTNTSGTLASASTAFYYNSTNICDAGSLNPGSECNITASKTIVNSTWIYGPGNLRIRPGATLSVNTGYLKINVNNLTIEPGAYISGDSKGYSSSANTGCWGGSNGAGPGYGVPYSSSATGAGYGGYGGSALSGAGGGTYGSVTNPTDLGSSGGTICVASSYGGGAILIQAALINNSGTITSVGSASSSGQSGGGGGSGGSIYLITSALAGNGSISANGGVGSQTSTSGVGGGGGGRIAVYYNDKSGYAGTITAYGGNPSGTANAGGPGTVYLKNNSAQLGELLIINNVPAASATVVNSPSSFIVNTIANSTVTIYSAIGNPGTASISSSTVTLYQNSSFAGDLILQGSALTIGSNYLPVGRKLSVLSGSTITGFGNSNSKTYWLNITAGNITIDPTSSINVNGKGYSSSVSTSCWGGANGAGPGYGVPYSSSASGAGYGGIGGSASSAAGGATYGNMTNPTDLGSSGGVICVASGYGGGFVFLQVLDTLNLSGTITSVGTGSLSGQSGAGGGSGGSIYIIANRISGNGSISANGGAGVQSSTGGVGGGGGGRIAIYYNDKSAYTGLVTSTGGSQSGAGNPGANGTVYNATFIPPAYVFFSPPTPADNSSIFQNSTQINATVSGQYLNTFLFNWNGTNYSYYDPSLVLAMSFNNNPGIGENSTKAVDISQYGNNGTIVGLVPTILGKYGNAMSFDGSTSNLLIPDSNSLKPANALAVESWIYVSAPPAIQSALVDHESASPWYGYMTYLYNFSGATKLVGEVYASGVSTGITSATVLLPNRWYHAVLLYDGSNMSLYINGVLDNSTAKAGTINYASTVNLTLGKRSVGATAYFNGMMDEVRIWNRTLSAQEVQQHYYSNFYKYDSASYYFSSSLPGLANGAYSYYAWTNNTIGTGASTETRNTYVNSSAVSSALVFPTLTNGTVSQASSIYINATSSGTGNVSAFVDFNRSLVGYWSFDNVSGSTLYDSSSYSGSCAMSGATQATGARGNSYSFSRTGTYADCGNPSQFNNMTALTLEAWVYPTNLSKNWQRVISKDSEANNNSQYILGIGSSQGIYFALFSGGSQYYITGSTALAANAWNHITGVWNGTALRIYINGQLQPETFAFSGPFGASNDSVRIGRSLSDTYSFEGKADEVRIWNRALSPQEINASYNAGTYRLERNFTNLGYGNYSFYSYAIDSTGASAKSDTRIVQLAQIYSFNFTNQSPGDGSTVVANSVFINTTGNATNISAFIDFGRSLVGYWSFDSINGTAVADTSTYGNNATRSYTPSITPGMYGNGMSFNGVNDYLNVSSNPALNFGSATDFTLEAWINLRSSQANYTGLVVKAENVSGNSWKGYQLLLYNNTIAAEINDGTTLTGVADGLVGTNPINDSNWHHVALVVSRSSSTARLYVDGGLQKTVVKSSISNNIDNSVPMFIGKERTSALFFNGSMDEVRVWSRALSEPEIRSSYNAGVFGLYANFTNLAGGTYQFYAYSTDLNGNLNVTETRSVLVLNPTGVSFVAPTPANNTFTGQSAATINATFSSQNPGAFIFNWNGTNYSYYDSSLVLALNLDSNPNIGENSTKAVDISQYGNNGTINGATGVSGRYGNALSFNGINNYALVNDSSILDITSNISIECWLKLNGPISGNPGIITKYQWSAGNYRSYQLVLLNSGKLGFFISPDGMQPNEKSTQSSTVISTNSWYHVLAVYNGSYMQIYVNGVPDGTPTAYSGAIYSSISNLSIGAQDGGGSNFFNGSIDEVRVWNRTLSAQEIQQQYYSNFQKYNSNTYYFTSNEPLSTGNYSYYAWANSTGGTESSTGTRFLSVNTAVLSAYFVPPTPADGSALLSNSAYVNVSVSGTGNRSAFVDFNRSLAGYWSFDNVSGTTIYDSGTYGNNGTAVSGPTSAPGKFGNAMNFSGANYVSTNYVLPTADFTVEFWHKPSDTGSAYARRPFGAADSATGNYGLDYAINGGSSSVVVLRKSGAYDFACGAVPSVGVWEHVVITVSSSGGAKCYRNGQLSGNNSAATSIATGSIIAKIGSSGDAGGKYNGLIDEVRIWNRVLSPQEVNASYNSGSYRLEANFASLPQGNYSFYAGVVDQSGILSRTETRTVSYSPGTQVSFPQNTSYIGSNSFLLNFTTVPPADSCWYSLNNGANTSIPSCQPATFTAAAGTNALVIYTSISGTVSSITRVFYYNSTNICDAGSLNAGSECNMTASRTVLNNVTLYGQGGLRIRSPASLSVNTGTLKINVGNLTVESGASISVAGGGYTGGGTRAGGSGPGAGAGQPSCYSDGGGGASYAGYGGIAGGSNGFAAGGAVIYGSLTQPVDLGSGGGGGCSGSGGSGGGAMFIQVSDTLTVNGTISADSSASSGNSGGGSGGSVYIIANTLAGSASITANGAAGSLSSYYGGGGSGGRIAIYYASKSYTGAITAYSGGGNQLAGAGTIYMKQSSQTYGDLIISNNVFTSLATPTIWQQSAFNNVTLANFTSYNLSITYDSVFTILSSSVVTGPFIGTGNFTVKSGATLSHPANAGTKTYWFNISAANLTIESGASINLAGKGYAGGGSRVTGSGPGGGAGQPSCYSDAGGGASYAGYGGTASGSNSNAAGGAVIYGSLTQPVDLGSGGGGGCSGSGGSGGGAVAIQVSDTVIVNGPISADSSASSGNSGGGSGGSIYIIANTFAGGASITANGASGSSSSYVGGGGSGGRIAIYYNSKSYTGAITAYSGGGNQVAGAGTIYWKQSSQTYGDLYIVTNSFSPLATPATWPQGAFNNVTIANMTSYRMPITYDGFFTVVSSSTVNGTFLGTGNFTVKSGATLSHPANSGSKIYWLNLSAANLTIESGASINVAGKGYSGGGGTTMGSGPGGGGAPSGCYSNGGGGASHASTGGSSTGNGGTAGQGNTTIYGSRTQPVDLGSGGGGGCVASGGAGGGAVMIQVSDTLAVNGTIAADSGASSGNSGGGSGGSIYLIANNMVGSASITANGGAGSTNSYTGGGGSGGRIAIYYAYKPYSGTVSVNGGAGNQAGGVGTIYYANFTQVSLVVTPSPANTLSPVVLGANYSFLSNQVLSANLSIIIYAEPTIYTGNRSFSYSTYTMPYNSTSGLYEYSYVPRQAGKIYYLVMGNRTGYSTAQTYSYYELNGSLISLNLDSSSYSQYSPIGISGTIINYSNSAPLANSNITFYIDGNYAGSTLSDGAGAYSSILNATSGGYHVLVVNNTG